MVISIASQKGGTGKTSTSISLAAGLAHKGKRVLLVDIDSQANSSKVLLHNYPEVTKERTIYANDLGAPAPGHPQDLCPQPVDRPLTYSPVQHRGLAEHANLFVFTAASPVTLSPQVFFGSAHWYTPGSGSPDILIGFD